MGVEETAGEEGAEEAGKGLKGTDPGDLGAGEMGELMGLRG